MSPYCRNLFQTGALVVLFFLLIPSASSNDVSISKSSNNDDASAAIGSLLLVEEDKTYWGREIRKLYNQMTSMPPESKISVDVSCSTTNEEDEKSCDDLKPPESTECPSSPSILKFTYIGGPCGQSSTTQYKFECQDSDGGPLTTMSSVHLECTSNDDTSSGMVLYDNEVTVGTSFSLDSGDKNPLPESIQCRVKDKDDHTLQSMTIGLTKDELHVKDIFGSIRLENCDSVGCLVEVIYLLTISNDGNTHLEITSVERTRNGNTENIIDGVPETSLDAGESTQTKESDNLDICISGSVQTDVEVTARPPTGSPISTNVVNLIVEVPGFPKHELDDTDTDDYEYVGKGDSGKGKGGGKGRPETIVNDDDAYEEENDDGFVGKGSSSKGGKKKSGKKSGKKASSSGKKNHHGKGGGKKRYIRGLEGTWQV